ncbi:MAG: glycosyltransferase [Candidatus Cloacimonetes bacterium]|nr:glycosyltransferase [Candidatus Cloacimonadota bacterium]
MKENITVQMAKDGNPVPLWAGFQLHSLYQPKKEGISIAEKFLEQIGEANSEKIIEKPLLVLGLGFAYHIIPLLGKFDEIYVAESCHALISEAKKIKELKPIFEKCRIIEDIRETPLMSDYHLLILRSEMKFQETFFRNVEDCCTEENIPEEKTMSIKDNENIPIKSPSFNQMRILVNSPIYGGSYTTAKYVVAGLEALGACVKLCDHSVAEPLLKKYINLSSKPSINNGTNKLIDQLNSLLSDTLWHEIKTFKPHLVFFIAQSPFNENLIREMKKAGITTMYWFVEDFRRFAYWKKICSDFDYFFMIQKGEFEKELKNNCKTIYGCLPVAAEPKYHKPLNLTHEEISFYGSDISFMGAAYPNRILFFRQFNKINLKLWGTGWVDSDLPSYNIPLKDHRITIEQSNIIYQASKVNINLHSSMENESISNKMDIKKTSLLIDKNGDFVNPRTFEIAACGGFQLVDDRVAIRELFVADKEIVFFSSVEEAIDKANFYLKNDDLRKKIALAGQQKTLKYHTYAIRLEQMINIAFKHTPRLATGIVNEEVKIREFVKKLKDKEFERFIDSISPAMRSSYSAIMEKVKESKGQLKKYEAYALLLDTFYTGE